MLIFNNKILFFSMIMLFLLGCTSSPRYKSSPSPFSDPKQTKKVVKSEKTTKKNKKVPSSNNGSYNPKKLVYKGIASFYGPKFHGKLTANGEIFDMYGVTAAHKEFPFNTIARVTNENNGKSLIIRINDRGPYIDGRILDCSFGAAKKLGFVSDGTTYVKIQIIEWGDGEYMHHD